MGPMFYLVQCEGGLPPISAVVLADWPLGGLGLSLEIRPGQFIGSWWPAKFGDWVAKRDKLVGINARFDPPPAGLKPRHALLVERHELFLA